MDTHTPHLIQATPASTRAARPPVAYMTLTVDGQLCGLPVRAVRDVLTDVQRGAASPDGSGSSYLRGRTLTKIDMRQRLALGPGPLGTCFSVIVEHGFDLYALMVDRVHEVVSVLASGLEQDASSLEPIWTDHSRGSHRVGKRLMVVLDLDTLLSPG